MIGYDLNEPIPHPRLEPVYKQIAAAIREVDNNHIVLLEGAQWGGNFDVFGPPFDPRAMYNFHKYWMEPTAAAINHSSISESATRSRSG